MRNTRDKEARTAMLSNEDGKMCYGDDFKNW